MDVENRLACSFAGINYGSKAAVGNALLPGNFARDMK
jgi:hypothetical protein